MMAGVLIPISSTTLGSSAASVTFSSIPQTYTDLVVRYSMRGDAASTAVAVGVQFNGISTNTYSYTILQGNGTGTFSASAFGSSLLSANACVGASATASTFSSNELYLPNYSISAYKPTALNHAHETNATTAFTRAEAGLFSNAVAVNSIFIYAASGNFVAGSTFHLYGVK